MSKITHMPRLNTILMVEKAIKEAKRYPSTNQLFRSLEKQVQYRTLNTILDYLESSNKITYEKDGTIIWIFADNPKLKKLLDIFHRSRINQAQLII
ncbi:MAG: hypothetical protein QXU32_12905 [Nitrososphaerales archaeon]